METDAVGIKARITQLDREIAERKELLQAYMRVLDDLEGRNGAPRGPDPQAKFSWRGENPTAAVRNAIRHMTQNYSLNDVVAWLKHNGFEIDRQKISFVLSRLAQKKEIPVVEKGKGQRPTLYAAPAATASTP